MIDPLQTEEHFCIYSKSGALPNPFMPQFYAIIALNICCVHIYEKHSRFSFSSCHHLPFLFNEASTLNEHRQHILLYHLVNRNQIQVAIIDTWFTQFMYFISPPWKNIRVCQTLSMGCIVLSLLERRDEDMKTFQWPRNGSHPTKTCAKIWLLHTNNLFCKNWSVISHVQNQNIWENHIGKQYPYNNLGFLYVSGFDHSQLE